MRRATWMVWGLGVGMALAVGSAAWAADARPFGSYVSPVTNPTLFEDPRMTTEFRPIYAYHDISDQFPTDGGHAQIAAAQLRIALTETFSLIATKDGYVWLSPPNGHEPNGWANIAFGAKYAFYYEPERNALATVGLRYETTSGEKDVFQGLGQGVFNPFLSALTGYENFHIIGYTDMRLPSSGKDTTFFDLSLHADYQIEQFFPLVELNWVQVIDAGRRLPFNQEGFDFFNLGSSGTDGNAVVTMAVGARYRLLSDLAMPLGRTGGLDFGAAYEFPVTGRHDIFGWRVTSDAILWVY